jgi:opacity protein-like surface antigen
VLRCPVLLPHKRGSIAFAAAVLSLCLLPLPADGQTLTGPVVVGSLDGAYTNGGTKPSLAVSVGYRFNRAFEMGIELTAADLQYAPADVTPFDDSATTVTFGNPKLDALVFTTNVRIDIPTRIRRILLYGIGGGGVITTTRRYTLTFTDSEFGRPATTHTEPPVVESSTTLALTLGGGISFRAANHVSFEVDARTLYARGPTGGSIARYGLGVSYKF